MNGGIKSPGRNQKHSKTAMETGGWPLFRRFVSHFTYNPAYPLPLYRKEVMKVDKSKEFDKQFTKEHKRLLNIFGNVNKDTLSVADGFIVQAARLKVLLDDAWEDIKINGEYEEFTQSENTPSYERERPISKIFTQRQGAYHKAISELLKLLPEEEQEQKRESLL